MTDNEIIKALEDLLKNFDGRVVDFMAVSSALDLINRQEEMINGLISGQETLQKALAEKNAEIERLKYNLEAVLNERADHSEAIQEFAERVKMAFYYEFEELIPSIMADKIDNLVKEMVGDAE